MDPKEEKWIADTAGTVPKMDAALNNEAEKQRLLDGARKVIEAHVGDIQLGSDFSLEMVMKFKMMPDLVAITYDMPTIGSDPNEEFDPVHDVGNVSSVDPKQIKKLQMAQAIVIREAETLRKKVDGQTRAPLFTDREIAEAIYEPLKRRKVMSEAMIPNRYSEVSTGFGAAGTGYDQQLAAYNDSLSKDSVWVERLGVAKDVLDTAGTLVKGVVADFKELDLDMGGMDPDRVSTILTGVTVGISSTIDTASTLIKSGGQLDAKVLEQVCKNVVLTAQAEIKAGFSGSSKTEQAMGNAIASGIGIVMNGATLAKKIKTNDLNSIADVGALVGDAVGNYLNMTSAIVEKQLRDKQGDKYNGELPKIFKTVATAAKSGFSSFGGWGEVIAKPSKDTLQAALQTMIKQGVTAAGKITVSGYDSSDFDTALTELGTNLKEIRAADEKQRKEIVKKNPALQPLVAQVKQEEDAARGGKSADELAKDWQKELDEDTRNFRDILNRSETGDSADDIETAESLIEQMKKDRMMIDLAFQLVTVGPAAVATFLPAAGIAVSAISLVKNLTKAYEHMQAFLEWRENSGDAAAMGSFQQEAMANLQGNARGRTLEACANVLKDAALVVTKSLSVAGPLAPAGAVATSVVEGVDAIKSLILKMVAKAELEAAYKHYLAAKQNPDNRKLIRLAVRKNATLAKYVIAWGALVDQNPVASRAMQKCGLTQEMLSNKNTNAKTCVSYLEALYPEDPVVMHAAQKPKDWYPGAIEFSRASVAAFAGAAEAKARLAPDSCRALVRQFAQWDAANDGYQAARTDWDAAVEEAGKPDARPRARQEETSRLTELQVKLDAAEAAVKALVGLLRGLKPVAVGGAPHADMADYISELIPLGAGMAAAYRRAAEALERQEGALQRDPDSGRIAA